MLNVQKIIEACDKVQQRTIVIADIEYMHSSVRCFDACMRAFTGTPKAEAITFKIFLNAPVMKPGEVTIHSDGSFEMRTI